MEYDPEYLTLTTEQLLQEIAQLRKQLEYESRRHMHWKSLAMIFHDTLWEEIRKSEKST